MKLGRVFTFTALNENIFLLNSHTNNSLFSQQVHAHSLGHGDTYQENSYKLSWGWADLDVFSLVEMINVDQINLADEVGWEYQFVYRSISNRLTWYSLTTRENFMSLEYHVSMAKLA